MFQSTTQEATTVDPMDLVMIAAMVMEIGMY